MDLDWARVATPLYSIGEELQHQSNMLDELGTDMGQAMGKTDQVLREFGVRSWSLTLLQ